MARPRRPVWLPRLAFLRVATRKVEQSDLWCDRLVGRPGRWGDSAELDASIAPLDELFERMIGQSCVEAFVDSERWARSHVCTATPVARAEQVCTHSVKQRVRAPPFQSARLSERIA